MAEINAKVKLNYLKMQSLLNLSFAKNIKQKLNNKKVEFLRVSRRYTPLE
jgi:hypothetical protein